VFVWNQCINLKLTKMETNFKKNISNGNKILYQNVKLGKNVQIGDFVIIGIHPSGRSNCKNLETIIGDDSIIRSHTVIYAGVRIGNNFNCGHGVKIREDTLIGDNSQVGTNSQIEGLVKIGSNVKIHTNVHIGQKSVIEDDVFIAPGTVLTNVLHPLCINAKECLKGPLIKERAKIGANTTILPHIIIGENALIGSGSVVVKDIPDNMVAVGNPAKIIKRIDELKCPFNLIDKPYKI